MSDAKKKQKHYFNVKLEKSAQQKLKDHNISLN